ncbi:hypothetical protein HPP92_018607 [Vanilla planifolia]|uniref:Pyruvate kinase n=1 Tax=Vanilla planifolia TaxID=51239 RepID=A0A835QD67_VANPL|nr:hypothetical protein HPP92_018607 [Vanilla planifolia]
MAGQVVHLLSPTAAARSNSPIPVSARLTLRGPLLRQRLGFPLPRICCAVSQPPPSDIGPVPAVLSSSNGIGGTVVASAASVIDVDAVTEAELKENGFRSTRRTKLVCTIGPATCGAEQLEALAVGGMNVARVNMCHGTHEWHRQVIRQVRRLNEEKGFAVAVMMDTEGSEIHMGDLGGISSAKAEDGEIWTFSVRAFNSPLPERTINVNYDGFAEDVRVGDELLVDGGMVRFEVVEKIGPDVKCRCTDPGLLLPRANLTVWRDGSLVRERNAMLPTISSKDWLDIDFGIAEGVDFIAVSFVKSAEVINHLKSYLAAHCRDREISVIAKIESFDCLKNLEEIILASDGAMVARGDLGAQIPLEQVPSVQQKVPEKALAVLRSVSLRIERWWREEKLHEIVELPDVSSSFTGKISEEICNSAAKMANNLGVDALFVFTKTGHMASLLSCCRPDCPIFAFTTSTSVRRRLNLQWGLIPFRLSFSGDMESNLNRTFSLLKQRGMIQSGDLIIALSDMLQSIQVM